MEQRITTPSQQKWLTKLMGYDYSIVYKKGSENFAANALSRRSDQPPQLHDMSVITGILLQHVKDSYSNDKHILSILRELSVDSSCKPGYILRDGLLYRKGKLVIGHIAGLRAINADLS
ncbi:uncharacterized protein [Nicotiana sylvestris]|uniref:uncharacterized protein n=1 Tax=Nicotiana sylvestris TaxID=4096 RepID=UPI00388CA017